MLNNLVPWKRQNGGVRVGYDDHSLGRLRSEFDQLWDRFTHDWFHGNGNLWDSSRALGTPLEWDDSGQEYVVRAELPGYEPDEIDVQVSGNTLSLRAERREESKPDDGNGQFRRYGSYRQTLTLPRGVIGDEIDARYRNGLLEIRLPKSEECQPKRIEVKS